MNKIRIEIHLEPEYAEHLEQLAKKASRSRKNYVEAIIKDHITLADHGYNTVKKKPKKS